MKAGRDNLKKKKEEKKEKQNETKKAQKGLHVRRKGKGKRDRSE